MQAKRPQDIHESERSTAVRQARQFGALGGCDLWAFAKKCMEEKVDARKG